MLTEVADGVLVHRSEVLRNNTVVVRGPDGVLVVDPGLTESELTCLAQDLRATGSRVVAGFATHPDWDHVLWHEALGAVPRHGTARCAEVLRELRSDPGWRARAAAGLPPEIADETPLDLYGLVTALPDGATEVPWDGPRVRVVEHPAHSPGHAALVVEHAGVLVAGDMLSDVFPPMLDDVTAGNDPVAEYEEGLRVLEEAASGLAVVVPGHGSVGTDIGARVALDRSYLHALREEREPDDPRIGEDVEPGWEWVRGIHEGQASALAGRRAR